MPNELKIVIDADVNQAIAGVQNLSKVISSDFTKATNAASAAASNLSSTVKGISDNQVKIDVNATGIADTSQRIKALEQQLINLEALKITPDISSTQLALFESNIQKVKSEISSLKTSALVVPIGVDVVKAQADVNILSESIETLRAKAEAKKIFITTETDITKIAAYNKEIQNLEARVRQLQNVGKKGFELFVVPNQTIQSVKNLSSQVAAFGGGVKTFIAPAVGSFKQLPSAITPVINQLKSLEATANSSGAATAGAFTKAYSGLRTLANIIPGIGIGGLIGIAATAVNNLTQGFFDAAFGASKLDKAIDAASESISTESVSIIGMVKALQSGTLTSSEFKKVKAELIAQAPEFQKTFDGDKISIEASDKALNKYIEKLTTTIRVTAALGVVNETLSKSIAIIAKGGEVSFGDQLLASVKSVFGGNGLADIAEKGVANFDKAVDQLKPENISKLLEDTFKKLGISFSDFAGTIDDKALKEKLAKIKADFEKFQTETIAKARQFNKEFGDAFVVPDLEEGFFKSKKDVFKIALKELDDIKKGNLKIKLPVLTTLDLIPDNITPLTEAQLQELTKGFFEGIRIEKEIPLEVTFDPSLAPGSIDKINKKLDLRQQFKILGDIGLKEFDKIFKGIADTDFTGMNNGIKEATKRLQFMMEVATTLNQAIGQGLSSAFNSVFDAILEGKSVFKALGEAIKQLVVGTIKAIAQMLILKAITNLIFPGAGGVARGLGSGLINGAITGGRANFGGIGSTAFSNVIQIVGSSSISGDQIRTVYSRATGSSSNFG